MPELPEVETVRRGLAKVLTGRKIAEAKALQPGAVRPLSPLSFSKKLKNKKIMAVGRIGKLLALELSDASFLFIHLKMTGQLLYCRGHKILAGGHNLPKLTESDLQNKYTRVIWEFDDRSKLFFNDMRKFGYVKIVSAPEKEKTFAKYGIEPLQKNFTLENFSKAVGKRNAPVKSVLLNQALIAGIGNIYADEICFHAGIRPDRKAKELSGTEIEALFKNTNHIIREAIKHGGTTFKDYLDAHGNRGNYLDYLMVYRRDKEKCLRCKKGIIAVKKVGGRGTRFCPVCQK
jgi:formamidopyrimidine-DNA glycosylase